MMLNVATQPLFPLQGPGWRLRAGDLIHLKVVWTLPDPWPKERSDPHTHLSKWSSRYSVWGQAGSGTEMWLCVAWVFRIWKKVRPSNTNVLRSSSEKWSDVSVSLRGRDTTLFETMTVGPRWMRRSASDEARDTSRYVFLCTYFIAWLSTYFLWNGRLLL